MRIISLFVVALVAAPVFAQPRKKVPVTGEAQPALAAIDNLMHEFMTDHKPPGAAVAVAKDGRLVYARGFGYAHPENRTLVQPTSLFRIASVSKAFTTAAICLLIVRGKLRPDTRVLNAEKFKFPAGMDEKWKKITIAHLIEHKAGFEHEKFEDPLLKVVEIAKAMKVPPPAKPDDIFNWMLTQPIKHEPGTKFVYSNFGYLVLGRVIAQVADTPYEKFVRDELLAPLGMKETKLGKTLTPAKGEVKYVDRDQPTGKSVFASSLNKTVPSPYGAWSLEAMDSDAGWITSAVELARFGSALDLPDRFPVVKGVTFRAAFPRGVYYTGALSGCAAWFERLQNGAVVVVLFNARTPGGDRTFAEMIRPKLTETLNAVTNWPDGDLFPQYLK